MLIPPLYDSYCAGHRKTQPENGAAKAVRRLQMHVAPDAQPKFVRIKKRNSPSSKLLLFEKIEWNANNDHEWSFKKRSPMGHLLSVWSITAFEAYTVVACS